MRIFQSLPFLPIVPVRGEGCYFWDEDGKKYLDTQSGVWVQVLGEGHPRFTQAIQQQLEKHVHVGGRFISEAIHSALDALASILPPQLNCVTFLNSGSEAVEFAIKVARVSTGKQKIASLDRGYYGATTQTLSLSGAGRQATYIPQADILLPSPYCVRCPIAKTFPDCAYACLTEAADQVETEGKADDIAALIFEPVQGNGGVIVPPAGYMRELAALAKRWDAVLIAEEVTTGMGRTGRWFGFQHDDIVPDILVLGKILGNGLPVSAVITTSEVEANCIGQLRHNQSHMNDPLSGATVRTVIEILRAENLIERSAQLGDYLLAGFQKLQQTYPSIIFDVRGKGLMAAIELQNLTPDQGQQIHDLALARGIILDYRPDLLTFRFFPAFVITESEIDRVLDTLDAGFRQIASE